MTNPKLDEAVERCMNGVNKFADSKSGRVGDVQLLKQDIQTILTALSSLQGDVEKLTTYNQELANNYKTVCDDRALLAQSLNKAQAECDKLREDKEMLGWLFNQTETEGKDGDFRVILNWNNYQDVAQVINSDGEVIGECCSPHLEINDQFILAIRQAMKGTQ